MVVRQTAHQFSNPVEASIKVFKQMIPNICDSNLTGFELALEMELISATLNTRPFKRIVRESNTFTLSPKALLFPIMSFQEVRNWLLHVGDQLNTSESWDGYDKLRSRNQSFLQHFLKEFLYNESSWRYGKRKGGKSVVKGEEIKPAENDIVAIKLSDGSYRIGIVINFDHDPIIAVRVILRGKNVMVEVHSSTMGLLSRDPAAIKKDDVAATEDIPQLDNNQQADLQSSIEALVNGGNHAGYFVQNLTSRQHVLPLDVGNHLKFPHKPIVTRYHPKTQKTLTEEEPRVVARSVYSLLLSKINGNDWLEYNLTVNAFNQNSLTPCYSRSLDYSNLCYYNYFRDSSNVYIDAQHHPRHYMANFDEVDAD